MLSHAWPMPTVISPANCHEASQAIPSQLLTHLQPWISLVTLWMSSSVTGVFNRPMRKLKCQKSGALSRCCGKYKHLLFRSTSGAKTNTRQLCLLNLACRNNRWQSLTCSCSMQQRLSFYRTIGGSVIEGLNNEQTIWSQCQLSPFLVQSE